MTPDSLTHENMCIRAENWLMASNRCRAAIAEPNCIIVYEMPDAIGWGPHGTILIECKTSRADFLADRKKEWRRYPDRGMGDFRYFMSHPGIIPLDSVPENWGLLHIYPSGVIKIVQKARKQPSDKQEEMKLLLACVYLKKAMKVRYS